MAENKPATTSNHLLEQTILDIMLEKLPPLMAIGAPMLRRCSRLANSIYATGTFLDLQLLG